MRNKILAFCSALALVGGAFVGSAHAEDAGFSIGGSFNGFGGYSHSDSGPPIGRAQAFFSELPTVCSASNAPANCVVNFTNVTPGDTDFGAYEASLSLVGVGRINEYAEMAFRIGLHAPGSGNDTTPAASPGEVNLLVEQAYADFHTEDGGLGLILGRLAPNVSTSLHAADRRTPYLSVARSQLLPSILTGAMMYFNADAVTISGMAYNDLSGANNQLDLDLGYSLAAAINTDEMDVRLSWFVSPEAIDAAFAAAAALAIPPPIVQLNPDNQNWVNVLNLYTGMNMEQVSAYVDLTWRRDGYAGIFDPQAVSIGFGGEIAPADVFAAGLHFEWTHANPDALIIPVGLVNGTTGLTDQDVVVINPYIAINLAMNTGIQLGWNWEHVKVDVPGDNNRNFHTLYAQLTAVLDSGAEPRSPTIHPLN